MRRWARMPRQLRLEDFGGECYLKSMEKLRYGTNEVIATVGCAVLFVLGQWLEMTLIERGIIPPQVYEWVQLRVLAVAIAAVFFGPISGLLCGLGGDLMINVIFESVISYPEVIVLGLYGFLLGFYFGKMHYVKKNFTPVVFADFTVIHVLIGILCTLFVVPLAKFMLEDVTIRDGVSLGVKSLTGNSILVGTICPVIMAVVGAIKTRRS